MYARVIKSLYWSDEEGKVSSLSYLITFPVSVGYNTIIHPALTICSCLVAASCSVEFDVDTLRDHRMRSFYQDRYDSRKNLTDWDYNAVVKDVASIIHFKQYFG